MFISKCTCTSSSGFSNNSVNIDTDLILLMFLQSKLQKELEESQQKLKKVSQELTEATGERDRLQVRNARIMAKAIEK